MARILNVHSVETSGVDGGGIRTVIFLQGCPLRCKYCHNPDAFSFAGGTPYTAKELAAKVARFKPYYGDAGGVTFSGGEPSAQADAVRETVTLLKRQGVNTVLETSGAVFNGAVKRLLAAVDYIYLDVKHTDAQAFKRLTGGEIYNTLKCLEYIRSGGFNYTVRQVVLKGFSDGAENKAKLTELAGGADKVEFLPYLSVGKVKWEKMGLKYEAEEAKLL